MAFRRLSDDSSEGEDDLGGLGPSELEDLDKPGDVDEEEGLEM
ncbi:MAG: hypothetical protein Q7R94_02870 [bacterium]|nr:hypothetical protein [bacterium]